MPFSRASAHCRYGIESPARTRCTVPYAIGNILLTISGPIVVAIVYAMRDG